METRAHLWGRFMRHFGCLFVVACTLAALPLVSARGDEPSPKARLASKGIRVTNSSLSLTSENELNKEFREVDKLRRTLFSAFRKFNDAQRQVDELNENLHDQMLASVNINGQLANPAQANFLQRNQLVAAANANASAINLLHQEQEQSKKEVDAARTTVNAALDAYGQQVLRVQAAADHVSEKYAELEKDDEVQAALKELNSAGKKSLELKPSQQFRNTLKQLAKLKNLVKSEKIPLRREGNSYYASVAVNGNHVVDMIVDTGASSLVLPYKTAMECGVKIDTSAMPIQMIVASGAKFKSKLVILDSVRVGPFQAEKVECVVLPPEATNAPILLGMTFLGRFNFSFQGTELVLSQLDVERSAALRSKKGHLGKTSKKRARPSEADPAE